MKKYKLFYLIFILITIFIFSIFFIYFSNNKNEKKVTNEKITKGPVYFSVKNINLYDSYKSDSQVITVLPQGTFFQKIAKTDTMHGKGQFECYWYKIKYNEYIGWAYGAYIVKYINQNVNKYILHRDFLEHLKYVGSWNKYGIDDCRGMGVNIYFGDEDMHVFDLDLDSHKLKLFFYGIGREKGEEGWTIFDNESYVEIEINNIKRCTEGYTLSNNDKVQAVINVIDEGNDKYYLIFKQIVFFKMVQDDIKITSSDIVNIKFKPDNFYDLSEFVYSDEYLNNLNYKANKILEDIETFKDNN